MNPHEFHAEKSAGYPVLGVTRDSKDGELWFQEMVWDTSWPDQKPRLECLLDMCCSDGQYIALKVWFVLNKWRYVNEPFSLYGPGFLHAATRPPHRYLRWKCSGPHAFH